MTESKREIRVGPDVDFILGTKLYVLRENLEHDFENIISIITKNIPKMKANIEDRLVDFEESIYEECTVHYIEQIQEHEDAWYEMLVPRTRLFKNKCKSKIQQTKLEQSKLVTC